ncbi:hypothetical protein CCB80_04400 [Armatimonadetes bacterium Uphvl-Ar1]|nr:hypothetical protein CCB80_04400 [Armatimonadetes bacterium Uphvl-Ar1]
MKKARLRFRVGAVLIGIAAVGISQATVVISDSTFANGNWSLSVLTSGSATTNITATQTNFFGNPAPSRRQSSTIGTGGVEVLAAHQYLAATIDPGSFALNEMRFTMDLTGAATTQYSFAIWQNGFLYASPFMTKGTSSQLTFTSGVISALDFAEVLGAGGPAVNTMSNPEWGPTGSAFSVGILLYNNYPSSANGLHTIDNFVVEVNPVPEPSLLLVGGLALAAICRRMR